jgi:hypothetical protein
MKIGLVGLPNSGKTTIFNALTRSSAEVTAYATAKVEPNVAVVEVGDERVHRLSAMYSPAKTTLATIDIVDFVGLKEGASKDEAMAGEVLRLVRNVDALAVVLRNFADDLHGDPAPRQDLRALEDEFLLSDLIIVEKRIEKIEAGYKRGIKNPQIQSEEKVLRRIATQLDDMKPVREMELSAEELRLIKGFQLLTLKPMVVILNSGESRFGHAEAIIEEFGAGRQAVEFAGTFEMELSHLDSEEEAKAFMDDMGISVSARDRLTRVAYDALGYISFFTVGEDEVRAWQIRRGSTAVDAAAAIHSDLARGFIRAECFTYEDLVSLGSEKAVKEKGLMRLEGKDYVVRDGDVLSIRYNV